MLKTKWTVADVLAESPCLSVDTIRSYFGGQHSLTIQQILDLPTLPADYKVWMACRQSALPIELYTAWRIAVLTRIITAYALPEPSTHQWAVRWLNGIDRTARVAAWTAWAAWAAGAAGAARAARATLATETTWAREAAWAAWAAWTAQAARTGAAEARDAEYHQQVRDLRQLLDSV